MQPTKKRYQILSPDNFPIERDKIYTSIKQAKKCFDNWIKNYALQGYYNSSIHGRIELVDIEYYCTLVEL